MNLFFKLFTLTSFVQFWFENYTFSLYLLTVVPCSYVLTLDNTVQDEISDVQMLVHEEKCMIPIPEM
jgi:hypothetical protein